MKSRTLFVALGNILATMQEILGINRVRENEVCTVPITVMPRKPRHSCECGSCVKRNAVPSYLITILFLELMNTIVNRWFGLGCLTYSNRIPFSPTLRTGQFSDKRFVFKILKFEHFKTSELKF